jgi:PHP domain
MHEYVGNIHVHTTYSDGASSVEEVAAIAGRAGLDFVMFSDHNTLAGLRDGKEGRHGGVLALIGEEVGEEHNHYLAWRIDREVPDEPGNPQMVIDAVRAQGGIGFIAHPFEKGCRYGYSGRAFTWDDWDVTGFTGICIWNFTSQWKGPITSPLRAIYYYMFPGAAVLRPDEKTLAKWDERLASGRVVAIGGTDAHAFRFGFGPLRPQIFPYRYLFRTINTHVLTEHPLTGNLDQDKAALYGALEHGRCFVSYGLMGDARGFTFRASSGSHNAYMGDEITYSKGLRLTLGLPARAYVRILRDGALWREATGRVHEFPAGGPGVYRAEVYRRSFTGRLKGWIFSNPIYVRP